MFFLCDTKYIDSDIVNIFLWVWGVIFLFMSFKLYFFLYVSRVVLQCFVSFYFFRLSVFLFVFDFDFLFFMGFMFFISFRH